MASPAPIVEFLASTCIGEKGQLTVPKEFRDELHLKPGAPVAILRIGNGLILIPEQQRFEKLCADIGGAFTAAGVSEESLLAALPQIRQEIYEEYYGSGQKAKLPTPPARKRSAK